MKKKVVLCVKRLIFIVITLKIFLRFLKCLGLCSISHDNARKQQIFRWYRNGTLA